MTSPDLDKTSFDETGFALVRGLASHAEAVALAEELDTLLASDVIDERNMRCRYHLHPASGRQILEALDPVVDLSPRADAFARSDRVMRVVETLLGTRAHLFKDKAIYKPPGARGYALHQDYIHWPLFPKSFTTLVLALDHADSDNGCIEVFPGQHHRGPLSPLDGDYHDLPDALVAGTPPIQLRLEPGDAAIFGCFLPHRSGPNRSQRQRRQLYLSYNAARDGGDQRAAHYRDFHRWLRRRYGEYGAADLHFK